MELDQARQLGYDWVFFTDDIFVVYPNIKQRMDLFQKMIQHNFHLKWIVQMRADVTAFNPELIRLGSEAGMRLAVDRCGVSRPPMSADWRQHS